MTRKIQINKTINKNDVKAEEVNNNLTVPAEKYLEVLNNKYPNKLNFTVKETSDIIGLSYDFVREKIIKGSISSIKYGDRFMVSQFELSRILSQGVS